jgi:hypothetical protein
MTTKDIRRSTRIALNEIRGGSGVMIRQTVPVVCQHRSSSARVSCLVLTTTMAHIHADQCGHVRDSIDQDLFNMFERVRAMKRVTERFPPQREREERPS